MASSSSGGNPCLGGEGLINCWIWPKRFCVRDPYFDLYSTFMQMLRVSRNYFCYFFCVNRRKWNGEVIFSSSIVWPCSVELNDYPYVLLSRSISTECLPLEQTCLSGFPQLAVLCLLGVTLQATCGTREKKVKIMGK